MTTTHSYSIDELQAQPLSELPHGSVCYLLGSADSQLYVKLDSESRGVVLMTLDARFTIRQISNSARAVLALTLPQGQLRLAIEKVADRESQFKTGTLMLSSTDGAVLVARTRDAHGFETDCYVSMLTWGFVDLPGDNWSLVAPSLMWHPTVAKGEPVVLWPPAATTP